MAKIAHAQHAIAEQLVFTEKEYNNYLEKLQEFNNSEKVFRDRPSFDDYFLGLAFAVSTRSYDGQTRHGTLLVDENQHILSTGYNSFPRKMPDRVMPNTRPAKYKFMLHSEICALSNLTTNVWEHEHVTAYITGKPCLTCLMTLWNAGVADFCMADRPGWQADDEQEKDWDFFIYQTKIRIRKIKPNLNWLKNLVAELTEYGFIQ